MKRIGGKAQRNAVKEYGRWLKNATSATYQTTGSTNMFTFTILFLIGFGGIAVANFFKYMHKRYHYLTTWVWEALVDLNKDVFGVPIPWYKRFAVQLYFILRRFTA